MVAFERVLSGIPEMDYYAKPDVAKAIGAIFDNEKTVAYHPELFNNMENKLTDFYVEGESLKDIIGVYSMEDINCTIYHDMKEERIVCSLDKNYIAFLENIL